MNEEDCDYYVESVFKLYGERKKGTYVCIYLIFTLSAVCLIIQINVSH